MKLKRFASFISAFFVSLSSLFVISVPKVAAATITWDGGGSDNNFSTAANWVGDTAPGNGDSIVLPYSAVLPPSCTIDETLNNDLNPGTVTLAGISFTGSKPTDCFENIVITGNNLSVSGDILGNDVSDDFPRAEFDVTTITLTAPATIKAVSSTGGLAIGSSNVTILSSWFTGGVTGSGNLTIDGFPGGSGGGLCGAALGSPFSGDSSGYSGAVTAQSDGGITITKLASDLARSASSITKASDGYLSFQLDNGEDMTLATPLTFNGGNASASQLDNISCVAPTTNKTVTVSGNVTFTAETTFYLDKANIKFTGTVTGKNFVKIADGVTGSITFPDGSSSSSAEKVTTINNTGDCSSYDLSANSKTVVNADCSSSIGSSSPVTVSGTLAGTGKVGDVNVQSGGKIAPGLSPGCIGTGDLTFVSGSAYDFELGGTTECTGYDRINVTGTVTLGNGTLNTLIINDFKPAVGNTFTIISNDAADAVSGTFNGLAQGATFTVSGYVFAISYTGGDGNDVVLTVQSVPAAPNTGFRLITANPLVTLAVTTAAALSVAYIARRVQRTSNNR